MIGDLLDLYISSKGKGLEVGSDGQGVVGRSNVGRKHHAVGVGVALVAHCDGMGEDGKGEGRRKNGWMDGEREEGERGEERRREWS